LRFPGLIYLEATVIQITMAVRPMIILEAYTLL
jgi:hypothetical protein